MNATQRTGFPYGWATVAHMPGSVPPDRPTFGMEQRIVSWLTMGNI
ncbi:MAG TPA: hypothetical protein VJP41_04605 [Gaiellaceae bacterium]|nr:hypothetical protein [Gaiellaceae bacterium]